MNSKSAEYIIFDKWAGGLRITNGEDVDSTPKWGMVKLSEMASVEDLGEFRAVSLKNGTIFHVSNSMDEIAGELQGEQCVKPFY